MLVLLKNTGENNKKKEQLHITPVCLINKNVTRGEENIRFELLKTAKTMFNVSVGKCCNL